MVQERDFTSNLLMFSNSDQFIRTLLHMLNQSLIFVENYLVFLLNLIDYINPETSWYTFLSKLSLKLNYIRVNLA